MLGVKLAASSQHVWNRGSTVCMYPHTGTRHGTLNQQHAPSTTQPMQQQLICCRGPTHEQHRRTGQRQPLRQHCDTLSTETTLAASSAALRAMRIRPGSTHMPRMWPHTWGHPGSGKAQDTRQGHVHTLLEHPHLAYSHTGPTLTLDAPEASMSLHAPHAKSLKATRRHPFVGCAHAATHVDAVTPTQSTPGGSRPWRCPGHGRTLPATAPTIQTGRCRIPLDAPVLQPPIRPQEPGSHPE